MARATRGKEGLTYYHHAEHSRRYPDLVEDLVPMIQAHSWYKFACCVPKASLAVLPQPLQSNFRLVAYSLAGRTVVGAVREWLLRRVPRWTLKTGHRWTPENRP